MNACKQATPPRARKIPGEKKSIDGIDETTTTMENATHNFYSIARECNAQIHDAQS